MVSVATAMVNQHENVLKSMRSTSYIGLVNTSSLSTEPLCEQNGRWLLTGRGATTRIAHAIDKIVEEA